jgi:hypothetical protein
MGDVEYPEPGLAEPGRFVKTFLLLDWDGKGVSALDSGLL